MTGKHRSRYRIRYVGVARRRRRQYVPRHRGVYDPLIGTALGKGHIGRLHVKIIPYLTGFSENAIQTMQALQDMVTILVPNPEYPDGYYTGPLGTKPDAPWVVGRE